MGVPSSAASYAAGQDLAPAALRSAGLLDQLAASGLEVHDDGDLPHQVWSPDRDHPLAQNAGLAAVSLQQLTDRLHPLLARGDIALVLGGNCTIALGVVAALASRPFRQNVLFHRRMTYRAPARTSGSVSAISRALSSGTARMTIPVGRDRSGSSRQPSYGPAISRIPESRSERRKATCASKA